MRLFRRILLAGVIAGCPFRPGSTQAGDVEDLKAAFARWLHAYNSRDLEDLVACYHEQAVLFGQFREAPVVEKTAIRESLQSGYLQMEHVNFNPRDPQFRVIDNTGVVWAMYALYWRGRSASGDEREPAVAAPGQESQSPAAAGRALPLVHRRL
jgi:ketosteroid isomerase-like protein